MNAALSQIIFYYVPSPPPALFIVMLPKAHLTLHPRMSGSRWVTTPSWLSGSWRVFFCTVLLCILATSSYYLLLVRSMPFLSSIVPIFAWNVHLVFPIFLMRSLVFPILLFFSISLYYSLKQAFFSLLIILWNCIQLGVSFPFSFAFCFFYFLNYL